MSHKDYPLSADTVATMTTSDYLDFLDFDAETVFCFTPSGIREVVARDKELGDILKDAFREMFESENDNAEYERRGFNRPMTDTVWAQKMHRITISSLQEYAPEFDSDEEAYAQIIAERIMAASIRQTVDRERGDAIAVANIARKTQVEQTKLTSNIGICKADDSDKGIKDGEPETQKQPTDVGTGIAPLDLYLSELRPGQGQIARMLVGSAAITTAPPNQTRRYWTEKNMRQIGRVSGYKRDSVLLKYYGEELRLKDIEVWMKILHLLADQPLGTSVTFNTRQFARALGRGIGTNTLKSLKATLLRLKAATFFLETTCQSFIENLKQYFPEVGAIQNATTQVAITFNMLAEYVDADNNKEFSVTVGRTVRALFGTKVSFWFDEALYNSLQGEYAKRFYLLYTSHQACYPLTRQEIREFFGTSMESDDNLHTAIRKALDQLVEKRVIETGWKYMMHPDRGMSYVVNKVKAEVPMVQVGKTED